MVTIEPYRFGFLLTEAAVQSEASPVGWTQGDALGLRLCVDAAAGLHRVEQEGRRAVLVGDAHVCHGSRTLDDCLLAIAGGDDRALDLLSGRFALLVQGSDGRRYLYHDAFGSRSIYYRMDGALGVASHPALLAKAFGDALDADTVAFRDSPEYKQRGTSYLPGDLSMYRNIVAMVPNHRLDLASSRSERYWPREAVATTGMEEFLATCDEYFAAQAGYIDGRYRAVLGLTGGVDSRSLIAALRANRAPCRLVTWAGGRLPPEERPPVERMIKHLGEPHQYLEVGRATPMGRDPEVRAATDAATGYSRGPSSLTANMAAVMEPGDVFLRGYGGEILRGFYNRHNLELPERTASELTRIYLTRRVQRPSKAFKRFAVESFEEYIERTQFDCDLQGLDALDVFYWEQRMGVWGATMLCEMHPALRSMAGFNSRKMYEVAFGLPRDQRIGSELLLELTRRYDPILAGLNPVS